jgi:hypothetical protein
VGARQLKAIQATTAAGLAESARLLLAGEVQGVCHQSQIDPAKFMAGPFVGAVYLGASATAVTGTAPVASVAALRA